MGFPSPAGDYIENPIDMNALLIEHPAATFFFRSTGQGMIDIGILPGSLLVVDRSITPKDRHIVVAVVDGEFKIRRLNKRDNSLDPENSTYKPIKIHEFTQCEVWGVVTNIIINTKNL